MTQDRIISPFTATSTAADVTAAIDLHGTHMIVTGGSSGIGVETARALATAGAAVTLAVRDPSAGRRVAAEINASLDRERVTVAHLDLIDPDSARHLAEQWGTSPLHALVCNAGIMAAPLQRTPAGWESQFATNHLGHFALATALHDALAAAGGARIVSVSSRGHLRSPVHFDDINFTEREYDPWLAYGQSKTANVLSAVEATRRWADDGITANAVHPGGIRTNLVRYLPDDVRENPRTDPAPNTRPPSKEPPPRSSSPPHPPRRHRRPVLRRLQPGRSICGRPRTSGRSRLRPGPRRRATTLGTLHGRHSVSRSSTQVRRSELIAVGQQEYGPGGRWRGHRPPPWWRISRAFARNGEPVPEHPGQGLGRTGALTTMAVLVTVSCPFLARLRIMLSLVSTFGVTPGFHLTMAVSHSGE